MKNDQLIAREGFSIFYEVFQIVDSTNLKKCLIVLEELLLEMKEIVDIKRETDVDHLLNNVMNKEIKESFLKLILKYWKVDSEDYRQYHQTFKDVSLYFHLFFSLMENNQQEFEKKFPQYFEFIKLKHSNKYRTYLMDDCKYFLFAASQGNHEKAIKLIIGCFTSEKDLSESYIKFMIKMLNNGFYLGFELNQESKELDLIDSNVLEQFLSSCITSTTDDNGKKFLNIDYTCFMSPEIRDINIESLFYLNADPGLFFFHKSLHSVSMILDNYRLKNLITHPVITLFTTLATLKLQHIRRLNLIAFVCFFVVPFQILFMVFDNNEVECRKFNIF